MSDVTIKYKGQSIATMDASGTKTLGTQGKYCEGDIGVEYVKPAGPTGTKQISIAQNGTTTEDVAAYANAEITVNVQGGGGGTVESGTYTPTERTMSHTITTQSEKNNFAVFAGDGYNHSIGSAAMVLAIYGMYCVGTNNGGTTEQSLTTSQGECTKSGNTFTYEAKGSLSSTSRCWQAGVTYHWFAW